MELKISLNEELFTNLCKFGYITKQIPEEGRTDVRFTSLDIKSLSEGNMVIKEIGSTKVFVLLQDIGSELIREIIKRSPIYSDIF
jgi:hypothetical protein